MAYKAEIPYGAYWSTPFTKWQGSLAHLHSVQFAAHVARAELAKRKIDASLFDYGVLGISVPQKNSFFGLPWLTGMIGAQGVGGPTISQACATGARSLLAATQEIESDLASTALVVTCDRTSNGPHVVYPNPAAPGGTADHENWVLDNFSCDPLGKHSMLQTAENVARKYQVSRAEQEEVVLRRSAQYDDALAGGHAFQKRYMTLPFDVPDRMFRKVAGKVEGDEGVVRSTPEGLAKLAPVMPDGTVTFGAQTHPADGNAAMVVTTPDKARALSRDPNIRIGLLGFGLARTDLAHMPEAPVPAAKRALAQADLSIRDMDAIKSHNPFAVNDIVFARETGADLKTMNNYGCSLVWGHPQAPTGLRAIIELIEELAARGGGRGLFQGCAAGDTAMAVVVEVGARPN
ncbi:MAG: thiolase family protein [Xanthobacteraceae bacterium]|uniref:thiolase family protein n=1 Tax=Pseudolabrys sp. TaxID=1960880 RepID=UPI003D102F85